jgi:hypothetical protein
MEYILLKYKMLINITFDFTIFIYLKYKGSNMYEICN